MNYINTFIEVAADSKASEGTAPIVRAGKPSVAELEYALIEPRPYALTQEDVQFRVHAQRMGLSPAQLRSEGARLREAYFATPRACMRTSPLAKTYGWGLHFDTNGRVALVSVGSERYNQLAKDPSLTHTSAMRSKKA